MEFSELIRARYSVRAYKPDPVEEEKLHQVIFSLQELKEQVTLF